MSKRKIELDNQLKGEFTYSELKLNYQQSLREIEHLKSLLLAQDRGQVTGFYEDTLQEIKLLKNLLQTDNNKFVVFKEEIIKLYEQALTETKELKILLKSENYKIISLNEKIISLEEEISQLKEQLKLMQHKIFGKKSEANIGEPITPEGSSELQSVSVSSYTRSKGKKSCGRIIDTKNLLRHRTYHDLPEEEKTCKCCNNILDKIGEDISEQIELFPAKLYVVEHVRSKYCCRTCNSIIMSPKPMAPIPKSLAGGSLITDIIINKYQYHLPLYRQSKMLESYNALIPDNTLGNLVMQAGEALMPIYEACWENITNSNYLQVDETPVKILNPNKKGYLWTYFAPLVGEGLVVYELALTRASQVVDERLANFKGLVQTDGYSGYNGLRKNKYITNLECMSHTRRKYDIVLKITNNKEGIAAEMIEKLKPLYALEKRMREAEFNFHTRKRLRQKYAKPLLKEIYKWLKKIKNQVPPKSKLMEAIKYTLNQWKYLIVYLKHGQAEIDNNWIENKNRPVALGRRNWLFMGNNESGKINALWFTFIESALINNLNPRIYIHYLLTQIHAVRKKTIDVKTLLPHTIDRAVLENFAIEQMKIAKEVFNSISICGKDNDFNFLNVYSRGYINKVLPPVNSNPEKKKKTLKDFLASININNTS